MLADDGAPCADARHQGGVFLGVAEVGAGADHRDRAAGVQCALVRGGVDALGQPAGHRPAGTGQGPREAARMLAATRTGPPAADDADLRRPQQGRIADDEQEGRRGRAMAQESRIVGVMPGQDAAVRGGEPGQVGVQATPVRPPQPGAADRGQFHSRAMGGGRQGGLGISVLLEKPAQQRIGQVGPGQGEQRKVGRHGPKSIAAPGGAAM